MDYTSGGLSYSGTPLQQSVGVTYGGAQPIVTAGQNWSGIVPAPKANQPDLFAEFSTWAAMRGLMPDAFNSLSKDEQEKIKLEYLNRNAVPMAPVQQSPSLNQRFKDARTEQWNRLFRR